MTVLDVFLLILIIVAIFLGVYLIFALKKLNNTLDTVQEDLHSLNNRIEPILENFTTITQKVVNISEETEKRVLDISNTIQNVKNTITKFTFKKDGYSQRNPVKDLIANITAISKGISAFWDKLNN